MQATLEIITPAIPNFVGRTAGKQLEELCIYRMQHEETAGTATMSRYGVQGSYHYAGSNNNGSVDYDMIARSAGVDRAKVQNIFRYFDPQQSGNNDMVWQPMQSLPDFEGVLLGGRQFVFDAKVCSQASFPLAESTMKERQLRHLLRRAQFGAISFLLIHFNARSLITKSIPARTIAFPVRPDHPFWEAFARGEIKRITEQDAELYGIHVEWNIATGKRKLSPDLITAIHEIKNV